MPATQYHFVFIIQCCHFWLAYYKEHKLHLPLHQKLNPNRSESTERNRSDPPGQDTNTKIRTTSEYYLWQLDFGRKWNTSMKGSKKTIPNKPRQIEKILDRRIVNLSNLLRKGLNFCPTPPPPRIEDINKDIDMFARRLTLRENHTSEKIDEITDSPGYQPSILHQLNQKERNTQYRPSREPYLNTYVERLRQEITDETLHNQRFQRNNLSKRERAALNRLSNNRKVGR